MLVKINNKIINLNFFKIGFINAKNKSIINILIYIKLKII